MFAFFETLFRISDFWILVPVSLINIIISVSVWLYQTRKQWQAQHRLYIVLHDQQTASHKKVLGSVLRKDFTRSEIRGLISMNAQGSHFDLQSFNNEAFFKSLHQLQSNPQRRVLCLEVKPAERDQFNLATMPDWPQYRTQHTLNQAAYKIA